VNSNIKSTQNFFFQKSISLELNSCCNYCNIQSSASLHLMISMLEWSARSHISASLPSQKSPPGWLYTLVCFSPHPDWGEVEMQLHSASVQKSEFAAPGALLLAAPRVIGTGRVRASEELGECFFSLLVKMYRWVYLSRAEGNFVLCFSEKRQEEGGGVLTSLLGNTHRGMMTHPIIPASGKPRRRSNKRALWGGLHVMHRKNNISRLGRKSLSWS
jgi:hypothetical protein